MQHTLILSRKQLLVWLSALEYANGMRSLSSENERRTLEISLSRFRRFLDDTVDQSTGDVPEEYSLKSKW